jgi:hypothetical protein
VAPSPVNAGIAARDFCGVPGGAAIADGRRDVQSMEIANCFGSRAQASPSNARIPFPSEFFSLGDPPIA